MPPTIALRFRYPTVLADAASAARAVAEVLTRPCFAALERVAAKKLDKFVHRKQATADLVASYLTDHAFEGVFFENAGSDMVASADVQNGEHARTWPASDTRMHAYVAVPYDPHHRDEIIAAACDLARAVDARVGAITVEPDHRLAQRWGLENPRPTSRPGLSERRARERRAHRRFEDSLATALGGPEWGTFLGPGVLPRLDREAIQGAAAKVVDVTPTLVYVQATDDPLDELSDGFDARLDALRSALAPVLMDLSALE